MSILKKQAARLLRGKFKDQLLAEEVYAVLASDDVIEIDSPVRIGPTENGVPPLTIINNPSPLSNNPPITLEIAGPLTPDVELPEGATPLGTSSSGGSGNAFSAVVTAHVSANSYTCTLYPGGLSQTVEMKNLAATAPSADLIGVWVPVIQVSTTEFHGFPSVFYGD